MLYELLKFAHLSRPDVDLLPWAHRGLCLRHPEPDRPKRSRCSPKQVRNIALFYDGLVVPARCFCLDQDVADHRVLQRLSFPGGGALARGDGAALQLPVRRRQHHHPSILHEAAPIERGGRAGRPLNRRAEAGARRAGAHLHALPEQGPPCMPIVSLGPLRPYNLDALSGRVSRRDCRGRCFGDRLPLGSISRTP